jgi:hypothetical protein
MELSEADRAALADFPDLLFLLECGESGPGDCEEVGPEKSYDVCQCGKLRWQHDEQWPACRGFRSADGV